MPHQACLKQKSGMRAFQQLPYVQKKNKFTVCYTTQQLIFVMSGLAEGKRLPADVHTQLMGFSAIRGTVQLTQHLLESSRASAPVLGGSGEFLSKWGKIHCTAVVVNNCNGTVTFSVKRGKPRSCDGLLSAAAPSFPSQTVMHLKSQKLSN